jgi:hypothetical protein
VGIFCNLGVSQPCHVDSWEENFPSTHPLDSGGEDLGFLAGMAWDHHPLPFWEAGFIFSPLPGPWVPPSWGLSCRLWVSGSSDREEAHRTRATTHERITVAKG